MAKNTSNQEESTKFTPSTLLAQAFAAILEKEPAKWGANQHLAMLVRLVLLCSKESKAEPGKNAEGKSVLLLDGKEITEITVNWATLKAEFTQSGKLAECANTFKYLLDAGDMKKVATPAEEYL